jgi:hypothetical protein
VRVPDYISPIIGHRIWRWDAAGLRSLNGKRWSPRQPVAAKCGAGNAHDADEPPHLECTCGVYAAKNIEHLRQLGYEGRGIRGEVHLWGTVVEHELGWRAQFAYPKSLVLLRNRIVLRIRRKDIVWNRQNMRWEAEVQAP